MHPDGDLAIRLRCLQLDEAAAALLRGFWPAVEAALPDIIAGFYAHVRQEPGLADMIGTQVPKLSKAQTGHWRRLFSGRFDDDYARSVRTIGQVHHRIGLEPRWYLAGYAFVLRRLAALAIAQSRWRPERQAALVGAVTTAVLLDADLAISTYQEALVTERRLRQERLQAAVAGFDATLTLALATVTDAAGGLEGAAQRLRQETDQTDQRTTIVAAAAEEASVGTQAVASAAEQLSASTLEINRQLGRSAGLVEQAGATIRQAIAMTDELKAASGRITEAVGLIEGLAEQTNLLALNATIEAARAGEAGRGFAVVAQEVKVLAGQTSRTTHTIGELVGSIRQVADRTVAAIEQIGRGFGGVSESASSISAMVEEQAATTRDIARNMTEAAGGTQEIARNISAVSGGAAATRQISAEVLEAATALSSQAHGLQQDVARFFTEVRVA